jgi:ketosteroid isomerase-like protein
MMRGFDAAVEQYHVAAAEFVRGNPEPYKSLFSQGEDVTVANPFGPPARGWTDVAATMERASSLWSEGEVIGFENVAKHATDDLGYIVEIERFKAKIGGSEEPTPVVLRTTSILRREDGAWKILHRHADPITTARPALRPHETSTPSSRRSPRTASSRRCHSDCGRKARRRPEPRTRATSPRSPT